MGKDSDKKNDKKNEVVYVVGHINPDTDSICSAIFFLIICISSLLNSPSSDRSKLQIPQ